MTKCVLAAVVWFVLTGVASAQTVLNTTVLQRNLGISGSFGVTTLGDATNLSVGDLIFVFDEDRNVGEAMLLTAIDGVQVNVRRGYGTPQYGFVLGALVYGGAAGDFFTTDVEPGSSCASATVVPYINLLTQSIFHCVAGLWTRVVRPGGHPTTGTGAVVLSESATFMTNMLFEGDTSDAFETTIAITDPTADRTITIPNGTGAVILSTLTTNVEDAANSIWGASNALVMEGATADANELTLAPADVSADRTVTFADATGTAFLSTLATNAPDVANSVWATSNAFVFEGVTADDFELSFIPADVTADRNVTFADHSGTVILSALATNAREIANSIWGESNSLVFEGATADGNELRLFPADVDGDRNVTFSNQSGTVILSSLTTNAREVADSLWGTTNGLVFEGATANGFETTISPADAVADSTATIPNITGTMVVSAIIAGGSSLSVNAVSHAGACVALDTAAGTTITLPAATGTGNRYCFIVTVTPTSNQHRVNVTGDDEFVGSAILSQDGGDTLVMFEAADGSDVDQINMNSGSQGGELGDMIEVWDISTDNWAVRVQGQGSGTEATPFATGQVS